MYQTVITHDLFTDLGELRDAKIKHIGDCAHKELTDCGRREMMFVYVADDWLLHTGPTVPVVKILKYSILHGE